MLRKAYPVRPVAELLRHQKPQCGWTWSRLHFDRESHKPLLLQDFRVYALFHTAFAHAVVCQARPTVHPLKQV